MKVKKALDNDDPLKHNLTDVETSSAQIIKTINDEIKFHGGNSKAVFLGGKSQGALLSLYI